MSRPSCICQPSVRTQPNVPLVQGLPTVPTKNFSSAPRSKIAPFAVGNLKASAPTTKQLRAKIATANIDAISRKTFLGFFGYVVEAKDDAVGFLPARIRRENKDAIGDALVHHGSSQP